MAEDKVIFGKWSQITRLIDRNKHHSIYSYPELIDFAKFYHQDKMNESLDSVSVSDLIRERRQ